MSAGPTDDGSVVLYGVMCTYRRPHVALEYLARVDRQTLRPALVFVVDNGGDPTLADAIAARPPDSVDVRYVDAGGNVGPAGAFRLGFDIVRPLGRPSDLLVHFDDDDPPVDDRQLELLVSALQEARRADPTVGAIGLSGGRLRTRTGLVEPIRPAGTFADVDHLHGGYLPVFTLEALAATGGNDPTFFYGFEELELGRRIHGCGFRQLVLVELAEELMSRYPKRGDGSVARARDDEGEWSRFHKERNLIRILRRERRWMAIAFTIGARHLLKPVVVGLRQPRAGWHRLVVGLRASWSGLRGRGGIDARYPPPGG